MINLLIDHQLLYYATRVCTMLMNVTVDHVCFTINTLDGHGLLITTRLLATAPRFREIKSKKREMDMYARELYYS